MLVSRECCHVTRIVPCGHHRRISVGSSGLGLKKWVMSCLTVFAEQGGLRREEYVGDTSA